MRGDTTKVASQGCAMGEVHRGGVPLNRPARREQIITGTGASKILRTHLLGEVTTKNAAQGCAREWFTEAADHFTNLREGSKLLLGSTSKNLRTHLLGEVTTKKAAAAQGCARGARGRFTEAADR